MLVCLGVWVFEEGVTYFFVSDVKEGSVVDASDPGGVSTLLPGPTFDFEDGLTHSGRCHHRGHRDSMCLP